MVSLAETASPFVMWLERSPAGFIGREALPNVRKLDRRAGASGNAASMQPNPCAVARELPDLLADIHPWPRYALGKGHGLVTHWRVALIRV